mgnify:CR=1 FL=1
MEDRLVYSTESGRITTCPRCGLSYDRCRCEQTAQPRRKSDGIVRVMRDRKQRGGKTVTVIDGVPGNETELTALAQQIQGDHCDKVINKLTSLGYKVKRAGG